VLIGRDVADALAQYGFPISKASLGQRVAYAESAVNPSGKNSAYRAWMRNGAYCSLGIISLDVRILKFRLY